MSVNLYYTQRIRGFQQHSHTCPSMLGFVKSFCGISDFFLKIFPFQSKFPLTHALMSCKAIYF